MNAYGWRRAIRTAQRVIVDAKKLSGLIQTAVGKTEAHSESLKGILDDLQLVFRLMRAWLRREYADISKQSLIVLVAAVVYFLMPIDAIIDAIPVIGLMDDVTVIGLALAAAKAEIEKFRRWEALKTP